MRLISRASWILAALSAVLQILIFPMAGQLPAWRAALCWIALVPLLLALLYKARSGKPLNPAQAALIGYFCGVLWYAGNCYWIYQTMYLYGGLPKPVSLFILLLFALYLGLYHALFAASFNLVCRSRLGSSGALLLTPFIWVAVELARARITGFPWDLLGYAQVDNLLVIGLAPVAGVMAISFLIAALNAAFAASINRRFPRHFWLPPAAIVLTAVYFLGIRSPNTPANTPQRAVMMQENLAVGAGARGTTPLSPAQELVEFSASSLHPEAPTVDHLWVPSVAEKPPAVILWPEAPSHFRSDDPAFRIGVGSLARAARAPVIAGSLGVDFAGNAPRGYFVYDSATLFDQTGTYSARYDKIHLVPWGEYIPFKRFFSFASKLTEGAGDMDPGTTRTVFNTGGHTYGTFVCYESIFGDEVRHFADNGAEVLVNISDDGWYGDTGAPWQHLNMARMRAIENRRWLLRSTNTGITTAIDPHGHIAIAAPRHVRGAYVFPFDFVHGTTFYTRHGDWFAYLCALVTLAALAYSLRRRID